MTSFVAEVSAKVVCNDCSDFVTLSSAGAFIMLEGIERTVLQFVEAHERAHQDTEKEESAWRGYP